MKQTRVWASVLVLSAAALAQTGAGSSGSSSQPAGQAASSNPQTVDARPVNDNRDDNNHSNWGWIGLLGLAGLAGLRRPHHVAHERDGVRLDSTTRRAG